MKGIEMKEVSILPGGGDGKHILQRLHFLVSGRKCFNLQQILVDGRVCG